MANKSVVRRQGRHPNSNSNSMQLLPQMVKITSRPQIDKKVKRNLQSISTMKAQMVYHKAVVNRLTLLPTSIRQPRILSWGVHKVSCD